MSISSSIQHSRTSNEEEKKEKDRLLGEIAKHQAELDAKIAANKAIEDHRSEEKEWQEKKPQRLAEIVELNKQVEDAKSTLASWELNAQEAVTKHGETVWLHSKKLDEIVEKQYHAQNAVTILEKKKIDTENEIVAAKKRHEEDHAAVVQKHADEIAALVAKKSEHEAAAKAAEEVKIAKNKEAEAAKHELKTVTDAVGRKKADHKVAEAKLEEHNAKIIQAQAEHVRIDKETSDKVAKQEAAFAEREAQIKAKSDEADWKEKNLQAKILALKSVKEQLEQVHGKKLNHIVID